MTEIPEHLLKRSKAAKAKASGEAVPSDDTSETSATPVAAAAQTPAAPAANLPNLDPEPEPAKPVPAFVAASQLRKRIPIWVMPVIAALPIWAYSFAGTMQQPEVEDVLFVDAAIEYNSCASCHGAAGGGGVGLKLSEGEVLQTFPEPIDQIAHVARGSAAIANNPYGAVRDDGERRVAFASGGHMPAQAGALNMLQLELVVFHERAVLSGEDTDSEAYQEWMEHMREEIESGGLDTAASVDNIDLLLACANPEYTPGAIGVGPADDSQRCPGPGEVEEGAEEAAAAE